MLIERPINVNSQLNNDPWRRSDSDKASLALESSDRRSSINDRASDKPPDSDDDGNGDDDGDDAEQAATDSDTLDTIDGDNST
jgi:hypothetical protein